MNRLRRLLRQFGFGERRWIVEPDERDRHTELVRSRLPGEEDEGDTMDPSTPAADDATDSVTG